MMERSQKIVIIGAGVFGLSLARQLASEGYGNILVLDRHLPPVPDGSSNDINRVIRFDYGDPDYAAIAYEAFKRWRGESKYKGIFVPTTYILSGHGSRQGRAWVDKTIEALKKTGQERPRLNSAAEVRQKFPTISGSLSGPEFYGYSNNEAGWADAAKAISQVRDECIQLGVSFLAGKAGTVISLEKDSQNKVEWVRTLDGTVINGDVFVFAAGAWTSGIIPMYGSTLANAQVVGYVRLTKAEVEAYKELPILQQFTTGWFNLPPHEDTQMLKMAIHGWGFTRTPTKSEVTEDTKSSPPLYPPRRANFVPADGEQALRSGLRDMLPELAERPFERLILCWYTDTPTGDFIMDYHPDHPNVFVANGGSGHGFKFLPVIGEYLQKAFERRLPPKLTEKWKFHSEYQNKSQGFEGDGSRAGPSRRELSSEEKAKL